MNGKPKPIEYYYDWLARAAHALEEKTNNPPQVPLTDPEWQTWIREMKQLASKWADAMIALKRQGVLHKTEGHQQ